jgi:hypothetical protein
VNVPPHSEGSESPETADRTRATYWREFYDRMITFEEAILSQMIAISREMPEGEQRLVEETNTGPLSSLIEDFKRRRDLWRRAALR